MIKKKKKSKIYTKDQKKQKAFAKGLGVGLAITVATGIVCGTVIIPKAKEHAKQEEILKYQNSLIKVLAIKKDVPQGKKLTKDDLISLDVPRDKAPKEALRNPQLIEGKIARMALPGNSLLYTSMLVDMEDLIVDDLRLQDYKHIILGENLQKGQYVDVRIKRPDGTDDIVLSKKKVRDLKDKTIWIHLKEDERLNFNAATVEADYLKGTLYTTTYVEPENQPAAVVTYKPNEKILNIIKKNDKVVKESMQRLEERNKQLEMENKSFKNNNAPVPAPEVPAGNSQGSTSSTEVVVPPENNNNSNSQPPAVIGR